MFVWFRQDLDGNSINQTILTDRIRDLYDRESSVVVETANTRYLFQKAAPPKPEFREESNLMELWLSPDGDGFCKGIHYDADGSPHVLKDWTNTGNWMKDRFLCYADDLSVTVAQYHPRVQALEWCDVYSRQHGFRTPFWIHNVSEKPMTFHLLPDDSKWEIESGGDLRIYPGTQEQQEV